MSGEVTGAGMTSQRPYLLRAIHEWISDNGLTPHVLVDANFPGVHVPPGAAKDGKVVLNIAERAVQHLSLGNEYVTFGARFGGVAHEVFVPVAAVLAIYSRETGQGMALPEEQAQGDAADAPEAADAQAPQSPQAEAKRPQLASVPSADVDDAEGGSDDEPPSPPESTGGKRPTLRVVK